MTDFRFKMLNFEQQAIATEREQIEEAYSTGLGYGTAHYIGDATDEEVDPANYYEETYGKEAGHE